ncbi:MAG: hypothetical protein EOO96_23030, partial [Pedobacter sp.]
MNLLVPHQANLRI